MQRWIVIDQMGQLKIQIKNLEIEYSALRDSLLNDIGPDAAGTYGAPKVYRGDSYQVKVHRATETKVNMRNLQLVVGEETFLKCIKPSITDIRRWVSDEDQRGILTEVPAKNPTVTVEPIG